jgi:membrane fusion protein, adhesin transport system
MRLGSRKTEHLAKSVLLEESGNPLVVRSAIWFSLIVVLAFLVWAATARVDEVAIADGVIVPVGQIQKVQHPEGGRIAEFLVSEGSRVEKHQVLLALDKTLTQSNLDETEGHLHFLKLQKQRLEAFLGGIAPSFPSIGDADFTPARRQARIFDRSMAAREADREIILSQIDQARAEFEELERRGETLARRRKLLDEERSMRNRLFEKGLETKALLLSLQRMEAEIDGQLAGLPAMKARSKARIKELSSVLDKKNAEIKTTALVELARIEDSISREMEVAKRRARIVSMADVRAPAGGVVHGLNAHAVGEVVGSGQTILEIVPGDRHLIAEIRIQPRDIGHVQVGQEVTLKFTAYDFARYGGIKGTLAEISATTFLAEEEHPFYKGVVKFDSHGLASATGPLNILPGMTLQADVQTGGKTVMEYLLKPIYASAKSALRER